MFSHLRLRLNVGDPLSFAGGKRDPSDRDVVDTALREAREELGITVAAGSVWGILKPLRDWVRKSVPHSTLSNALQPINTSQHSCRLHWDEL